MKDLIEALTIFLKYVEGDVRNPTHCEHDVMTIVGVDPDDVSDDDKTRLDELGFFVANEYGEDTFISYRYGSA